MARNYLRLAAVALALVCSASSSVARDNIFACSFNGSDGKSYPSVFYVDTNTVQTSSPNQYAGTFLTQVDDDRGVVAFRIDGARALGTALNMTVLIIDRNRPAAEITTVIDGKSTSTVIAMCQPRAK